MALTPAERMQRHRDAVKANPVWHQEAKARDRERKRVARAQARYAAKWGGRASSRSVTDTSTCTHTGTPRHSVPSTVQPPPPAPDPLAQEGWVRPPSDRWARHKARHASDILGRLLSGLGAPRPREHDPGPLRGAQWLLRDIPRTLAFWNRRPPALCVQDVLATVGCYNGSRQRQQRWARLFARKFQAGAAAAVLLVVADIAATPGIAHVGAVLAARLPRLISADPESALTHGKPRSLEGYMPKRPPKPAECPIPQQTINDALRLYRAGRPLAEIAAAIQSTEAEARAMVLAGLGAQA